MGETPLIFPSTADKKGALFIDLRPQELYLTPVEMCPQGSSPPAPQMYKILNLTQV